MQPPERPSRFQRLRALPWGVGRSWVQAGAVSSLIAPGALWLSHLLLSQAITAGAGLSQERCSLIQTLCPTDRGAGQEWRKKTWDTHVRNLPGLSALAEIGSLGSQQVPISSVVFSPGLDEPQ